LLLLKSWAGGLPLLVPGLSQMDAFFGGMSKMDALPKVVEVSSPEVGANIVHLFSNAIS
jgi:hypothetical protein